MHNKGSDRKPMLTPPLRTLSTVVWGVLQDIEAGAERFNQFLKYAVDGARAFNFDVIHDIHSDEFEMLPWKQICFPSNMVDWTKIGFRSGDRVIVFVQDTSLPKVFDKIDCEPQAHKVPNLEDVETVEDIVYVAGWTAGDHYYGRRANINHAGYFDVDNRNRVFNFKRTVGNLQKVYLEWITDGINYSGQTLVHPYANRALELYIHWQRKEYDDRYSAGEAERAKILYEKEFDKVVVRNLNLSIEDIHYALRSGYGQTVKN